LGFFKDIATPLIARGIPVTPLTPRTKAAFLSGWQKSASSDADQIDVWDRAYPESNCGSVAKGVVGQFWMLEVDDPSLPSKIEAEAGQPLPKTFRVRSSPGKGHLYFKQTAASIAMGNITQPYVKDKNFSVRVNNEYVVSPGSWHPTSGRQYEVVSEHEIVEAPEWLIEWIIGQRIDSKSTSPAKVDYAINSTERIPRGTHDVVLTQIAGKWRSWGMEEEALYNALVEVCEKRCDNYGTDYKQMCRKIARSIGSKPTNSNSFAYVGSQQAILPPVPLTVATAPSGTPTEELEDAPIYSLISHPKFPSWIMNGTSLYTGFAKPYCDVNSRYEEFMWMPAFALMLNYIGTKVNIYMKNVIPSLFMVLVGKRGEVIKSSSVQDAIMYFHHMGFCDHAGSGTKNAEGKSLVWTAGSPEGLGIDVQRTNCKNIVLFYDELSILTNKAGIDSSGLVSTLLGLYESAKFQNKIKSGKESYSIDPGTYCATLIACSTDKNFLPNWSKLCGDSTGLDDRFFFLYQPEKLKDSTPQVTVNTMEGAIKTRKLIDAAVAQGTFRITDDSPLAHQMKGRLIDNREGIRVEKFALGFAIDLGKTEIDEECIERALALIKYEKEVKKYLAPFEASTMQGAIQMEMLTLLKKNNGNMLMRDVNRSMHPTRLGTDVWLRAYGGLVNLGYILPTGAGTKSDPKRLLLLRAPEEDEE
jgi:hypothetical protein